MHTMDQKEYGEANLGTKGMALFFSSHICNPICLAMGEWCQIELRLCWWCHVELEPFWWCHIELKIMLVV